MNVATLSDLPENMPIKFASEAILHLKRYLFIKMRESVSVMQKNIDAATPVRTGTLRRGNGLAFYDTQNGLYIEYWNRVPYSGFQHTAPYKLFFAEREMVNRVSAMFNLGFKTENGYARGEKVHAAIWKGWK